MDAVVVKAAVAVLPTVDGREAYHYEGAVLPTEGFTEAGLEHALGAGLIEQYVAPEPVEDETPAGFSQADVDAAVKAAEDAKDSELAEGRRLVEARAQALAEEIAEFEKVKAAAADDAKKAPAAKAPAAKQA